MRIVILVALAVAFSGVALVAEAPTAEAKCIVGPDCIVPVPPCYPGRTCCGNVCPPPPP